MYYFERDGADKDVVFSTRIRFARNLKDYPFASKLDRTSAAEIIEKTVAAAGDTFQVTDMTTLSAAEANRLLEQHFISRAFLQTPLPHALLTSEDNDIAVMVCEEDHIRLQAFAPGLALRETYRAAVAADIKLCEKLAIAENPKLGYLTHCPTNLGTGMRASVMLCLPALARCGRLGRLMRELQQLGIAVRGMYGEGSDARGALYQISNRETLGVSEEATLRKLEDVVERVIALERTARTELQNTDSEALADAAGRAYGICRYAKRMQSAEFLSLYADLRLGVCMGLCPSLTLSALDALLFDTMPASISLWAKDAAAGERTRDTARATLLRKRLAD